MKNKITAKELFGCLSMRSGQLLSYLLLIGSMAFSTASYSDHDHPTAGTADYKHYPQGGSLFVTVTFGPDGRLWRIVPENRYVYVDYSIDLGKTFSTPVRINNESQRIKASDENRPGIVVVPSDRIYVTYAAEGNQPIAQYFSVSTDFGRSFRRQYP